MAIGDNGNSRNENSVYEPTYYSRLKFAKYEGLGVAVNYRSGLMIIEINKTEDGTYKPTPVISIFLSPTKAKMLSMQLKALVKAVENGDIDPNHGYGVNAGMGEKITYIAFTANEDKEYFMTIGKFDGNGQITESAEYKFAKDYNYALEWNNLEANDLSKVFYNMVDIESLTQALEDFSRSASGALGYGTLDLNRFEARKEANKFDQIFDKLGIERRSYGGNHNYGATNNFLTNASSKSTTIEDLEENLLV